MTDILKILYDVASHQGGIIALLILWVIIEAAIIRYLWKLNRVASGHYKDAMAVLRNEHLCHLNDLKASYEERLEERVRELDLARAEKNQAWLQTNENTRELIEVLVKQEDFFNHWKNMIRGNSNV